MSEPNLEVPDVGPIDGPQVWHGKELLARSDFLTQLSDADIEELTHAAPKVETAGLSSITRETFPLPTFGNRLAEIQDRLENGSGAVLIHGFPVGQFSEHQVQRIFLGIAQHIGTPISQSAMGERIFHVRDEGFGKNDPRTRGPNTRRGLSFHTDRCDVIAFLCVQQAMSGGENALVSSAAVYNEIRRRRPDLWSVLLQPFFYKRHNVDVGNDQPYCRQPIFSFCEGHFAASYLRVLIERAYESPELPSLSAAQIEALNFLENVAEEPGMHVRIRQEPGDILILNNWVTFHRRTEFEDHLEPERKRHLLRIWLSVPNSRPIHELFKENFGATAAGAIRGGMRPSRGE